MRSLFSAKTGGMIDGAGRLVTFAPTLGNAVAGAGASVALVGVNGEAVETVVAVVAAVEAWLKWLNEL